MRSQLGIFGEVLVFLLLVYVLSHLTELEAFLDRLIAP